MAEIVSTGPLITPELIDALNGNFAAIDAALDLVSGTSGATDADVRSAAAGKVITTELLESAAALVALSDAAPVAVDWDAAINFSLTVTADRQLQNPTNVQVGTTRTITILGNNTTDRTITFGSNYKNVPTITDCDSGKAYTLTLFARTATSIVVMAVGYAI